jgi:hypothetical protein
MITKDPEERPPTTRDKRRRRDKNAADRGPAIVSSGDHSAARDAAETILRIRVA